MGLAIEAVGDQIEWRASAEAVPYPRAVEEMESRVAAIRAGTAPEFVWLLEHPPLYTAGTSARDEDLLEPGRLPVHRTGRGGRYTYHGPGQRIAYVMLDLARRGEDVHCYVHHLEEWAIRALARLWRPGRAARGPGRDLGRGAAAGEAKIAAIGVRVRRWVTYHGMAINLDPDLDHYRGIIPCGIDPVISGHGVTSLADLGIAATMADVDAALRATFAAVFDEPPARPMTSLFENQAPRPLADRLRPKSLAEIVGQDHLLGAGRPDRADGGEPAAVLDDPVGTAGLRQDDDRAAAGERHRPSFRAVVGGVFRGRRSAQGVRRRAESGARWAMARCCSSTKSTASTARSRTPSCRWSRTAP